MSVCLFFHILMINSASFSGCSKSTESIMPSLEQLPNRILELRTALDHTRSLYSHLFNLRLAEELHQVHIIEHSIQVRIEQLETILANAKRRAEE